MAIRIFNFLSASVSWIFDIVEYLYVMLFSRRKVFIVPLKHFYLMKIIDVLDFL